MEKNKFIQNLNIQNENYCIILSLFIMKKKSYFPTIRSVFLAQINSFFWVSLSMTYPPDQKKNILPFCYISFRNSGIECQHVKYYIIYKNTPCIYFSHFIHTVFILYTILFLKRLYKPGTARVTTKRVSGNELSTETRKCIK